MCSRLVLVACAVAVSFSSLAVAQVSAGVSDERVKLPGAPGSLDGVGENATIEGNQGALRQSVPLDVPKGFPGLTPEIALNYSSTAGSDVVGIGWMLPSFSVERMTSKGLQKYDADDRFVADGAMELVRTEQNAGSDSATYRERYEGGFVRYTWKSVGNGHAGYWTAEYPDGRIGYFGADSAGVANTASQVRDATNRVFRWHLNAIVDRYGHQMRFVWTKDASGTPLLERINYVFDGAAERYSLRFIYENRDDVISDARPGFELRLTQRLKEVRLVAVGEVTRAWVLSYEPTATTGRVSRLAEVRRFGRNNLLYPIVFKFGYSKTLEGVCAAGECDRPFVKSMGSLPAQFSTGRATLIDMNGDALPDVLDADAQGRHTFYYSKLDTEGQASFVTTGVSSAATNNTNAFVYGASARIQVLDVNGDGFVDMTESTSGSVLCNNGSGDWQPVNTGVCIGGTQTVSSDFDQDDDGTNPGDVEDDEKQVDPQYVRFFDYDNDRRIDRLRTTPGGTGATVLLNAAAGQTAAAAQSIGVAFDESPLELADMNGDGLQDPAQLITSSTSTAITVWYRLNLGYGTWGDIVSTTLTAPSESVAGQAELEDINGDGLADVVAVASDRIYIWLNRNTGFFDDARVIDGTTVGSALPTRTAGTTIVTFADMNGNGSDDVVYIEPPGGSGSMSNVSYVELFPVRPNLLSRVENGIGAVQVFSYGTSISEQTRDTAAGQPWQYRVPNPMTVVTEAVRYVTLTGSDSAGLREITSYRYHSGFYNGAEKQFGGYVEVERETTADMSRDALEPSLTVQRFNVGETNPLFGSALEREQVYAMPGRVPLRERRTAFEACPVEGAMGTTPVVSFLCERATDLILYERDAANAVTVRTERDYDGFGQVTALRELGVVNRGTPESPSECAACVASGVYGAACGMTCSGDERITERTFVTPLTGTNSAWIVGRVAVEKMSAAAGVAGTETRTFYDGPSFEGLAQGQLTNGTITRVARRVSGTEFIDVERNELDTHGNVVVELEPTATLTDALKGRTRYTFETAGLLELSRERLLGGAEVSSLKRETAWDLAFSELGQVSNEVPYLGANALATAQITRYRYDDHGRIARILDPGDTDARPGESFVYELANPASRVERRQHSSATSGEDVISAQCFDGRGRVFQTLKKLSATDWQVDGFVEFDGQGAPVREYESYRTTSPACATMPPGGVGFTALKFDGLGRGVSTTSPGGSVSRTAYGPLVTTRTDENGHVVVERADGLNRPVSIERQGVGDAAVTSLTFDVYGNVATSRDAAGKVRTQTWDAMGRLTNVDDLNAGAIAITYDAASNPVRRTDAAGNVVVTSFDPLQRRVAQFSLADEAGTKRTWQYDLLTGCAECTNAGGKLVRKTWPGSTAGGDDAIGYDAEGRNVFRRRTLGGKAFVFRNAFDDADREISTIYPGGLSIERTFDGADRVSGIANIVGHLGYDERGNPNRAEYANGTTNTWTWDADDELATLEATDKAGAAFLKLAFTRDAKHLTTAIDDGALAGRVRHGGTFTRDAWDRVLTASLPREGAAETLTWSYDAIDNVTSIVSSRGAESRAHAGDLSYGARPNATLQAGGLSYDYDAAGRLSARGAVNVDRDFLGRIVSATGGAVDGRFTWGDGERVERVEGDSTTWYFDDEFEVRDGISVAYVRVSGDRVARLESDSLAATIYSDLAPASGDGTLTPVGDQTIDIADAWLAQAAGKGVVTLSGGPAPSDVKALLRSAARRLLVADVTWLHTDAVNSVVAATDIDGALIGERSFFPTGAVRESNGFVDAYGFSGQLADESTGLVHFENRNLDVLTARWDEPDPEFEAFDIEDLSELGESTTGYAYVANEFLDTVDPDGLKGTKAKKFGPKKAPLKFRIKADVKAGMKHMKKGMTLTKGQKAKLGKVKSAIKNAPRKAADKIMPYTNSRGNKHERGVKNKTAKIFGAIGAAVVFVAVMGTLGGLAAAGKLGGGGGGGGDSNPGGGMGGLFGGGGGGSSGGGGDAPSMRLGGGE